MILDVYPYILLSIFDNFVCIISEYLNIYVLIFLDPRQWSREDVARWIQYITTTHHLPSVHLDRFLMNGKALCLMSIDMFVNRVPLGGKLLYKDFQLRLSRAMYSWKKQKDNLLIFVPLIKSVKWIEENTGHTRNAATKINGRSFLHRIFFLI